jgi:hypothetical protein
VRAQLPARATTELHELIRDPWHIALGDDVIRTTEPETLGMKPSKRPARLAHARHLASRLRIQPTPALAAAATADSCKVCTHLPIHGLTLPAYDVNINKTTIYQH